MNEGAGRKSFSRVVNLWAQTIAIVAAGAWGVYVFVFEEFTKPAAVPINLTTEMSIHQAGTHAVASAGNAPLLAIELDVTATNPSSRTVYVLPNYWIATGVRVASQSDQGWVGAANNAVAQRNPVAGGEHYQIVSSKAVALGSLISDTELMPNERTTRSYVFYVPASAYDFIDIESALPSVSQPNAADVSWRLDPATNVVSPTVFLIDHGHRRQLRLEEISRYSEHQPNLQMAVTRRQLSLWGP
jgi:hypothetical protein